ncbi:hypothetical protein E3T55_11060 [Cryobacterium frigoriphilum]|uniref:Uncharacterized protein n=1 Tax=Cryobacterium frigoriphilum TaxID=1259150 RepID=A0A4R8ZZP9_9MICO|nr:hypothetical protein [Cryobacterium frigoriphilum]TFD49610.1 hypothetical protein E3T55_11060 [Cryobacterium frigoriphilum]
MAAIPSADYRNDEEVREDLIYKLYTITHPDVLQRLYSAEEKAMKDCGPEAYERYWRRLFLGQKHRPGAVSLDDNGTLEDRLARPFPWIKLLSVQDQRTCARDIIDTARGAFVVNQLGRIVTEIKAWRNTAEAVAAGWGQDEAEWLREPVTVTKPRV